jgi:3-oxoacyl-[acyl-carrier-protein] synthase-3
MKRARAYHRRPAVRAAKWEQCQSDFCHAAAVKLMHDLDWSPESIDVVVLVTLTPDYPIPATAIIIQDRLGIPKTALAFDLPGGNATLLHGMQLVASMLSAGHLRRGLLLCGEVSKVAEGPESIEGVEHICGHNGGVFAFEHAVDAEPMFFHTGGNGAEMKSFYMPVGGTRCPPRPEMFAAENGASSDNTAVQFVLDMTACQAAALRELPVSIESVLSAATRKIEDVECCFVGPIGVDGEEAIRAQLGLRNDRFHGFTHEYGSGGSGSLIFAMLAREASRLQAGRCTSVFAGIGAGLAWSSALITTERLVCPDFIVLE